MMSENPWRGIAVPGFASAVNALRVDADLRWNFFWARSADHRVLLTLQHDGTSAPSNPLPSLRDIEVSLSPPDVNNSQILALKLLDLNQLDIFHTLCRDIIECAAGAESEEEAVALALMRTWRWHHLLRGGSSTLLSAEAQRGLLGEMLTLERFMLPNLDVSTALTSWKGPMDSPKDFQIGRTAIEVKARRGGSTPSVRISSEDQLDNSDVDHLFLHVIELNEAPEDAPNAMTLQDAANRIRRRVIDVHPGASHSFETLLLAAGLRPEDDYSGHCWLEGTAQVYLVRDDFPRIMQGEIRTGVSRVQYNVSLGECRPFAVPGNTLIKVLTDM